MSQTGSRRHPAVIPQLAAGGAILASSLALFGWWLELPLLKSLLPGAVQMKANAALGLLLSGVALFLRTRSGTTGQVVASAFALLTLSVGAATLFEYLSGADLGIDEALFRDQAGAAFNAIPGRMSPFTASALALLGLATLLVQHPSAISRRVAWISSMQIGAVGALCLVGYGWNASDIITDSWLPPVALNTAIVLTGLASGLLSLQSRLNRVSLIGWLSPEERSVVLSFWALVIVLVAAMGYTYRSNLKYVDAAHSAERPQQVRLKLAQFRACLSEPESLGLLLSEGASRNMAGDRHPDCQDILRGLEQDLSHDAKSFAMARDLTSSLRGALDESSPGLIRPTRAAMDLIRQIDSAALAELDLRRRNTASERSSMLVSLIVTLTLATGIFGDLTRRMRQQVRRSHSAREQTLVQKTLIATVINSIPDLIVYKGLDGTYIGCNEAYAASVGRTPSQVVGRRATDLFDPDVAAEMERQDRDVMTTGLENRSELWMDLPKGSRVLMDVVRSPLRDRSGAINGVLAVARDITIRKQEEEALRQAQAIAEQAASAKSAFLASMSHEIRTPMTGVLGMIDLLAVEELTPKHRRYVESMRASGRHLLHIINDILDYSRIEAGKLEVEQIDFLLPDLLERARSLLHPMASERGLTLRIEQVEGVGSTLVGDPTRIQQVLLNLASNAIKFTSEGQVMITSRIHRDRDSASHLVFEVEDTGVGIEAAELTRLFAPFSQADSSISRRFGGSGLGLAISQRLATAMGGRITAASTPGEGSVFTFEVPVQIGAAIGPTKTATMPITAGRAARILVAEDNQTNRDILHAALSRQGHVLQFAHDGSQALAMVEDESFDLVLMDIQMPGMDGVEATRRIRRLPGHGHDIPIIALTANVMAAEQQRYLNAGMNECLMKPIDWDRLFAAISRWMPKDGHLDAQASLVTCRLIDEDQLAALKTLAGADQIRTILASALDSVAASCVTMNESSPDEIAREAHRIKGSGGTMGLHAIAETARRIEEAGASGAKPLESVAHLSRLVVLTRHALGVRHEI